MDTQEIVKAVLAQQAAPAKQQLELTELSTDELCQVGGGCESAPRGNW
jgi:hypothetical protein